MQSKRGVSLPVSGDPSRRMHFPLDRLIYSQSTEDSHMVSDMVSEREAIDISNNLECPALSKRCESGARPRC